MQQKEHVSEEVEIQQSYPDEVCDNFQSNRKSTKAKIDLSEATVDSKVKSSIDKTELKGQTNQQRREKDSQARRKGK